VALQPALLADGGKERKAVGADQVVAASGAHGDTHFAATDITERALVDVGDVGAVNVCPAGAGIKGERL
jgi:hypothetical protein